MEHKIAVHKNCDKEYCVVCHGGLSICEICGGAESSLATHCPQTKLTPTQQQALMDKDVDYVDGVWEDKRFGPDGYLKNPHNLLVHHKDIDGNFIDKWTCSYCNQSGTFAEMSEADAKEANVEFKECTYTYPPCDSCKQTPICAENCSGLHATLSGNKNHTDSIH